MTTLCELFLFVFLRATEFLCHSPVLCFFFLGARTRRKEIHCIALRVDFMSPSALPPPLPLLLLYIVSSSSSSSLVVLVAFVVVVGPFAPPSSYVKSAVSDFCTLSFSPFFASNKNSFLDSIFFPLFLLIEK